MFRISAGFQIQRSGGWQFKKRNNMSKKGIIVTVCLILPLLLFILWGQISMKWSKTTCANILKIERSRGYYVWFNYDRNGTMVKDNMTLSSFKFKNLYELKKKKCCNIKYSIFWPYRVEIIDKELKSE